jgi:hypothetical protein
LRTVLAGECFLDRMQHAVIGQILDRNQFRSIELPQQRDARIDRFVDRPTAVAHNHDGACAAIAFRAAFFGSGRSFLQTQPVEHGRARRKRIKAHGPAAPQKLQGVSCHGPVPQTLPSVTAFAHNECTKASN